MLSRELTEAIASATPIAILRALGADYEVRAQLAGNPSTPEHDLRLLAGDMTSRDVRRAVAANPSTPAEALRRLVSDPDSNVRYVIARRRVVQADILRLLATDTDAAIRRTVTRRMARSGAAHAKKE